MQSQSINKKYWQRQQYFLTTEDQVFQDKIIEAFPNQIIYREKDIFVESKLDKGKLVVDSNLRPKEQIEDAVLDLYLLAQTNFGIFHPRSSFGELGLIKKKKES